MVRRWVSSKSNTWELIPLASAACITSRRSLRPRTVACAGPENGREGGKSPLHGFVMRSADRAGHPIEQRARRFLADRVCGFVGLRSDDPMCELSGDILGGRVLERAGLARWFRPGRRWPGLRQSHGGPLMVLPIYGRAILRDLPVGPRRCPYVIRRCADVSPANRRTRLMKPTISRRPKRYRRACHRDQLRFG